MERTGNGMRARPRRSLTGIKHSLGHPKPDEWDETPEVLELILLRLDDQDELLRTMNASLGINEARLHAALETLERIESRLQHGGENDDPTEN